MKTKEYSSGQSLIELVFAIGVIVLVLAGVVALLVSSLHSRTEGFDRKKAAELGQKVMDLIIEESKQNPAGFWDSDSAYWVDGVGSTKSGITIGYPGFNYAIGFVQDSASDGCDGGTLNCMEVTVGVGWSAATNQNLSFSRFFSK